MQHLNCSPARASYSVIRTKSASFLAAALFAAVAGPNCASAQTAVINGTTATGTYTESAGQTLTFTNGARGGSVAITNNGGNTSFLDTSTAESAAITNNAYGVTSFNATSTAGSATIINNTDGLTNFWNTSTAGSTTITNTDGGRATFYDTSSANSAAITNNNGGTYFNGTSTGGSATIVNNADGNTDFNATSTAGNATITNNANGWTDFNDTGTGGNATITNNTGAATYFNDTSTGGNATITNNTGAATYFFDTSTGGNAQLINQGPTSLFDFSSTTGPNGDGKVSAGSLAGAGTFFLGRHTLTVGSNNLDTTVTGVIRNGGIAGGTGGSLVKVGTGTMTLAGINTYTGSTTVAEGVLQAGIANTIASSSGLAVNSGATFDLNGFNQTITSLNNAGTVLMGNGTAPGTTLTVNSITGQGGTFVLNTVLGGDGSMTDRIVVNGGTVTGSNFIRIVNAGGLGAQTTGNGIQLVIAQNGATTAAGSFVLSGRVAAGAYEYSLLRGDLSGSGEDWYLRSQVSAPDPVDPVNPADPVNPGVPAPTDGLRPEVPVNAAVMPLASAFGYAMLGTLHERNGGAFIAAASGYEEQIVRCKDAKTNFRCAVRTPVRTSADNQRWMAGGWARIFADHGDHRQKDFLRHGSDYDYTLGGVQAGQDVFVREQADGALDKVGVYAGYGTVRSNVRGVARGKAGSADLNGGSVGAYWTHYGASGWYTDMVAQGTWLSADARSVKGEQIKPDGFSFLASLEGGYQFKFGSGWSIEPQAQVIYQTISFDDASDHYGVFRFRDNDSVRARIGARLARTWNTATDTHPRLVSAWLRANVWREFSGKYQMTTATLANTDPFVTTTTLGGAWGEIGAGITAQVSDTVNLFATGAYQHSLDDKGLKGWNGRLGASIKW